jgi:hypothetical protein
MLRSVVREHRRARRDKQVAPIGRQDSGQTDIPRALAVTLQPPSLRSSRHVAGAT